MPVVFLIIFLISAAHTNSKKFSSFYKLILAIYLLTISIISTNLSIQHRELTAVAKLREYLISYKSDIKIFTNPLINYYLTSTGVKVKFINSVRDVYKFEGTCYKGDVKVSEAEFSAMITYG